VIVEDFHEKFDPKDPLGGDLPSQYRRAVLEPGGSMSAKDLVNKILGRPQQLPAFQHWLNREFEPLCRPLKLQLSSSFLCLHCYVGRTATPQLSSEEPCMGSRGSILSKP
jgi:hypothetical protein